MEELVPEPPDLVRSGTAAAPRRGEKGLTVGEGCEGGCALMLVGGGERERSSERRGAVGGEREGEAACGGGMGGENVKLGKGFFGISSFDGFRIDPSRPSKRTVHIDPVSGRRHFQAARAQSEISLSPPLSLSLSIF